MVLRSNCIDETGHIYGKLEVIEPIRDPTKYRKLMWRCKCICGNEIVCSGSDLRAGRRTSCGKRCNHVINEIGNTYGTLIVLKRDFSPHN